MTNKTHFCKAFILIILILSSSALKAQTFAIGHTTITYTDPARAGRSIVTELYYPATTAGTGVPVSAGAFPVIIYGHGFVMTWDAYQNFWDDLVPQGYIIAFPKTEGSFSPSHAEFGKDLKFLVTKLQSESATNAASLFYNHINAKSAVMGHSMGGGSAFLAAESNTAITTMVTFAAANTTPSSISAAGNVSVPTLVFSGENDCVAPPVTHQTPMYDSLVSACKTFISVKGGAHCEFANNNFNCSFGQSTCSPSPTITRTQQQDATSDFLKLWLEYYLKDNCNSWDVFNDSLAISPRVTHQQVCTVNSPVISLAGAVLTSSPAATYQWYLNGTLIPGANFQNYTTTAAGNYHVEVTYFNACPYPSNIISILSTDVQQSLSFSELLLYPNPVSTQFVIEFTLEHAGNVSVKLRNILGQTLSENEVEVKANSKTFYKQDVAPLRSGVYFVEIKSGTYQTTWKILKE